MHFFQLFIKQTLRWLVVASFFSAGLVMAQSEPTLGQVYAAAQAGKLDQAQLMVQQVLISHPNSAKAYFVQSELYARQANPGKAREALATAEKLAPGLPFAKASSVQSLRAQLAAKSGPEAPGSSLTHSAALKPGYDAVPVIPAKPSSLWLLPLLLAVGVMALGYVLFRKKQPDPLARQPGFATPNGLNGPQTFGMGQSGMASPPPPYGQAPDSGLGGRIMGGVATGLAVGAGVMAAQAIGRGLMGEHAPTVGAASDPGNNDFQAFDRNPDMGGADFGISDTSSWDSGSGDAGGTSDWDN
jgi:hypothetical protein